jgi:DNA-binding FadR family transcriptional regulator
LHFDWKRLSRHRPPARTPLAAQIIDQLRRDIVLGEMREHERLPPLRTLAALYGVSIPTLRQAMQALSYLGVVDVRPGSGTFVAYGPQSGRALIAGLKRATTAELAQMRRVLEVDAASGAAAAAPRDEDLDRDMSLWLVERQMASRYGTAPRFLTTEANFHQAVVAAAGSAYALGLHAQVLDRLHDFLAADCRRQGRNDDLDDLHASLVEAIREGGAGRAARLAREIAEREAPSRAAAR